MPKAVSLTPDEMNPSATHAPAGAMSPRGSVSIVQGVAPKPERKITEAFQLRLPPAECIEIKVDATRSRMSQSEFLLACYRRCKEQGLIPFEKMPHQQGERQEP